MELVHVVRRVDAVGGAEGAEHLGGELEVDHVDGFVALDSEAPLRDAHHKGVPFARSLVAEHLGGKLLEGVVGRSAKGMCTVGKKIFSRHFRLPTHASPSGTSMTSERSMKQSSET